MKRLTINLACKNGEPRTANGVVMRDDINGKTYRFLIHSEGNEKVLTHIESGFKVGSLSPIMLRYFNSYKRLNDRGLALILLSELVEKYGAEFVSNAIDSEEVIN